MTETLTTDDATVSIDPDAGGRLSSLVIGGHELLVGPGDGIDGPMGWGCFPMIPWAGRIRHGRFDHDGRTIQLPLGLPPHAIHGTTYLERWEVTGPGTLEARLGRDWPWPGRAQQVVDIAGNRLSLTITVECDDDAADAMPVTAGWHPWFRRSVDGVAAVLTLPAERMWQRDEEGIPDGSLVEPPPGPWDDCFTALVGPAELRWPGLLHLYVESDCDHVVVYDELDVAVCVEPQSGPPDAHNSGEDLVLIEPGESWSITTTWLWQLE